VAPTARFFSHPTRFAARQQGGGRLTGRPRTHCPSSVRSGRDEATRGGWHVRLLGASARFDPGMHAVRGCTGGTLRRRRGPRSPGRNLSGPIEQLPVGHAPRGPAPLALPPPATCTRDARLLLISEQERLLPRYVGPVRRPRSKPPRPRSKPPRRRSAHFRTWSARHRPQVLPFCAEGTLQVSSGACRAWADRRGGRPRRQAVGGAAAAGRARVRCRLRLAGDGRTRRPRSHG
jgi:hypothetical protein